jgi:serine/threonine-protein kinase
MLGTPYYMSPEQAQGIKQVDFRTDLWALAVIVYQSLTGRLPFESEALGDLLVRIIVAPLPVPSQIAPVPPGFDAWWAKAASRDPNERFQSAKEVADSLSLVCGVSQASGILDVRGAQGAPPEPVASVGTGAPMSRTVPGVPSSGSRMVLAGGIGLAALAVLGIGGVALWKMSAPTAEAPKAAATAMAAPPASPEPPKEVRLVETTQPKETPAPASASAAEPPAPTPPPQPVAAAAPSPVSPPPSPGTATSKRAQPASPVNHPAASAATSKSNKASYNAGF